MVNFKVEKYGADVATIHATENQIVEVVRRRDGLFDLTIHRRDEEANRWDDMTAELTPIHFLDLGEVADHYQCVNKNCPSFGQRPSRSCRCHPSYRDFIPIGKSND